jgi:hypothetical protein
MSTVSATSAAVGAWVSVALNCRDAGNLDADARTASLKVAVWLGTRDITTLAGDFLAYVAEKRGGEATDASRRHAALLTATSWIAQAAATESWSDPGAELELEIDIWPGTMFSGIKQI